MQKKLLFISQMYPYPPDGGGKIKTLNTIRALTQEYEISAVFVSETQPTKTELYELEKLSIRVKVFYSDKILASVKDDLVNLAWHFVRGIPHYVFQYTHKPAFPYIHKLIHEFQPDIIHVDHLNMAQYLPKEKHGVWLLEHHNVETHLYWTRFLYSRRLARKLYLLIEMILTFIYEWKTLRRFDHVFAISREEENRLKNTFRIRNTSTQPLVYPTHPIRRRPAKHPYILFIGNLGWPPNEDAVQWFLRDIFPLVLQEIPDAEFHVVGKREPRYEKSWPRIPNVFLHGYQKSLDPYLAKAHVFILPFRMGGGLRLKSLTALAAGIPIVATPRGVEGLPDALSVIYGLIAQTPEGLAARVMALLRSDGLREIMRRRARSYIRAHYGKGENKKFFAAYQQIIQEVPGANRVLL